MPEWAGLQNLRKSRCSGTPPTSAAEAALSCCSYGSAEAEPFQNAAIASFFGELFRRAVPTEQRAP